MNGVKHMKWWGWGVEGIAFHHEDKPNFAPFVLEKVGLDVNAPSGRPPTFDEIEVPASQLGEQLRGELVGALGEKYVVTEHMDRVVHTFGKSVRDLVRMRRNQLKRIPDVVVYPADEDQVRQVVDAAVAADAVLIPFGGGSNIVGALEPLAGETRQIVSLDLGRLNKVLEIDEESGLARIQAGALGPALEEQLNRRGWTMGHFPDSFTHSTLGGWIATRSSGMQSDKYGDIGDVTRGLRMVQPGAVLVLNPLPATSTGPSVREMILGSEGRLGVITEAWVNVHRLPEERVILAYFFPTWSKGLRAMQAISKSDAQVIVARISDDRETAFSFSTQKKQSGVKKYATEAIFKLLQRRGWDLDKLCMSFIGFEGTKAHVARQKQLVKEIVTEHGGMVVGKGPGALYDQKKFDTPYLRDFLLDRGAAADVSETAAPYSKLETLYDNTIAAAEEAMAEVGCNGYIMCHLSHNYHSGACLYFTFAIADDSEQVLEKYDHVKRAIQQSFIDSHGTLSHHHGVGLEHAPWMAQDISPAGERMIRELFDAVDPKGNLNPGKVVHEGKPGITVISADHETVD
ncbi:FAD-binding oxidoreductase [Naumannella sp. ID2617S]|uniref:FAD-binding oxidoreductase n=1 Tax=Enemella dayhoffiae TaxID=2016507 RepID=A0A255GLF9_9ACTN|nr:FAD-binding oxidoreductase [Enemella dayhoffiae]NNG20464.1 FAD-binding oxidoreductase [Naumannella sp. ID2617S]OYO16665.1 FAD-binding oxidoreductase [Enemella dayhoffiae]